MALRYPLQIKEALANVREGGESDLSSLVVPRLAHLGYVKEASDDTPSRTRDFFLSDKSVDRDNDTIAGEGWGDSRGLQRALLLPAARPRRAAGLHLTIHHLGRRVRPRILER